MNKTTHPRQALVYIGLGLLPVSADAQTASLNGEEKTAALSIHFLVTLGLMAVIVIAFYCI